MRVLTSYDNMNNFNGFVRYGGVSTIHRLEDEDGNGTTLAAVIKKKSDIKVDRGSGKIQTLNGRPSPKKSPGRGITSYGVTVKKGYGHLVTYPKTKISEKEITRNLRGKAHVTESSNAAEKRTRDILMGRKIGALSIQDPAIKKGQVPIISHSDQIESLSTPPSQVRPHEENFADKEDGEYTEEDFLNMAKDLETPIMDEDMVANDDLLDDEVDPGAEQIEAISQMSPVIFQAETQDRSQREKEAIGDANSRENQNATSTQPATIPGNRRKPATILDTKGTLASKKMQSLRAKASPKKKPGTGKLNKSSSSSSQHLPRNEVFPSTISKKFSPSVGSVVSQKPPSMKI